LFVEGVLWVARTGAPWRDPAMAVEDIIMFSRASFSVRQGAGRRRVLTRRSSLLNRFHDRRGPLRRLCICLLVLKCGNDFWPTATGAPVRGVAAVAGRPALDRKRSKTA
jgi:hypothetical protein